MSNTILNPGVIPNTADAVADLLESAAQTDLDRIKIKVAEDRAKYIGDTFYLAPSVVPSVTDDGHAVQYRSNGAPVLPMLDGFVTSSTGSGQRAWYAEVLPNAPITRLGAEFRYKEGGGVARMGSSH